MMTDYTLILDKNKSNTFGFIQLIVINKDTNIILVNCPFYFEYCITYLLPHTLREQAEM